MPTAAKARNRPETILQAAQQAFLAAGYDGASVDLIAANANVSKATLYAHFGSKERLFVAVVEAFCAAQEAAVAAIEEAHSGSADGLYRVTLLLLAGWAEPDALRFGRMVMGETMRFPGLGRLFAEAGIVYRQRIVAGVLRRLAEAGALAVPDPDLAAELLVATGRGLVQARSLLKEGRPPARRDLVEMARAIVTLVTAAYALPETAGRKPTTAELI